MPAGCSSGRRLPFDKLPKGSRTVPEQFPKQSRRIVEGLSKDCRRPLEQLSNNWQRLAVIYAKCCQLLPKVEAGLLSTYVCDQKANGDLHWWRCIGQRLNQKITIHLTPILHAMSKIKMICSTLPIYSVSLRWPWWQTCFFVLFVLPETKNKSLEQL